MFLNLQALGRDFGVIVAVRIHRLLLRLLLVHTTFIFGCTDSGRVAVKRAEILAPHGDVFQLKRDLLVGTRLACLLSVRHADVPALFTLNLGALGRVAQILLLVGIHYLLLSFLCFLV